MNKNLVFPSNDVKQRFVYKNLPLKLISDENKPYKYPCIVLVEKDTKIPVLYTGFERYLISDTISKSLSETTLNKKAYCIVEFLNYLLHYSNRSSLTQITIDDIKTFLLYQKTVKKVGKDY